ncbi:hypothetical protein Btru_007275 [Bulinus truncatus]|nr:hypothetical protein Btru_007275 [Bulinus truncatus]
MNAQDWERIQRNWTELLQVHPAHIKNYLYQEDVLTLTEKKFIDSQRDQETQMKIILDTIKEKPKYKNAYKYLITCLGHDPVNKLIADKMEAANPKSDASLCSKPNAVVANTAPPVKVTAVPAAAVPSIDHKAVSTATNPTVPPTAEPVIFFCNRESIMNFA